MAQFVHYHGQQVDPRGGRGAGLGQMVAAVMAVEITVHIGRGADEPALAGGGVVDQDGIRTGRRGQVVDHMNDTPNRRSPTRRCDEAVDHGAMHCNFYSLVPIRL